MTKANDEASDFDKARTNEIGLIATMRERCDFRNGVMPSDLLQRAVYKWNRRAVL